MTPTFAGSCVLIVAAGLWLWKSSWRPYLEIVIAVFGGIVGFGGMGIALYDHVLEHNEAWGWRGLFTHMPHAHTWTALAWHVWPALLASAVVGHWWYRGFTWHKRRNNNG